MLRALRFPVEQSRGRKYPELGHPYRNPFQRDRDRIIHARAFRRLEAKTQVFTPGLSDHFRNRLTHTIEVSQIARTAAAVLGLDENLTEALALVHDIGHPPFAHAGEDELNCQMQRFDDCFDHNLHALRIVETFEQRYARFPGLNLTFEVREGMVKHSRDFEPGESAQLDEYLPGLRPPLEAQLIDLADEVAYNAADIDDAFSAGLLGLSQIAEAVPAYADILADLDQQFPGASERERFQESVRRLIDLLVTGLIEGTIRASGESGARNVEEVRRLSGRIAAFTPEMAVANRELKSVLHRFVYSSEALANERRRSTAMIAELFSFLIREPGRLPDHYLDQSAGQPVHRVVCDYIAGMTDGFFHRTYEQLLGPLPVATR